jgi:membrane fusion protein, multidrug efflux system
MEKNLIIAAFLNILLIVSCTQTGQDSMESGKLERIEPVRTLKLDFQTIARTVDYTSTLQALEEIHLAPSSPGRIEQIFAEVGTRVRKDDILVQMDRIQLHQAEIQLRTLEIDYKRFDTLKKAGSIAQQQYDQLESQLEIARNNVNFYRENTSLRAPFSGVVSGKYFEPGEMFLGSPNPQIGKAAIVSLVIIDRLKILVPVSERFFPHIQVDQEALIVSDIYPDRVFTGRVFRIHPTIDRTSRTFNVEISLDNTEGILRPGMFCRVRLDIDVVQAMLVPAIAVLKLQGSNERYLFSERDGRARRISVIIGNRYDDQVEVISGELQQGDHVIVSGQARLLDGMPVSVIID